MSKKFNFDNPAMNYINKPSSYQDNIPARETRSKRLNSLITPSTFKGLQNIAQLNKCSVNELVNKIFEEYIQGGNR